MNVDNFSATLIDLFEIQITGKFLRYPSVVSSVRNVTQLLFGWIIELFYLKTEVYMPGLMFHA